MRAGNQQQEKERTNESWQVDERTKGLCLALVADNYTNLFPLYTVNCSYSSDRRIGHGCSCEDGFFMFITCT